MPNCDFYAMKEDCRHVLAFVFSKTDCRVYETYSDPGRAIREFTNPEEVLLEYARGLGHLRSLLTVYSDAMAGEFLHRRIDLDASAFGEGAQRFQACGWGVIQLHLGGEHRGSLGASHTNHNSEKRAHRWFATNPDMGSPGAWNWKEGTRVSNQINRFIRKIAVDRIGSRPVLSQARDWQRRGGTLAMP